MKSRKSITVMVILIAIFSLAACLAGLLSKGGPGEYEFRSITGELVKIYGIGLYRNDSVSIAAQGKASDLITLILGIPVLIASLHFALKGSFRARLVLAGTLGYFLYTYVSYTFYWNYNPFFIVYTMLMGLSLFAFIMTMMTFDVEGMAARFRKGMPVKPLGGFQIFIAVAIGMLWLGKLAPSVFGGAVPEGLEHYTTMVIQGMDLAVVVPASILSGILLIRRKPMGYLLFSVMIIKGFTMLTAISAMMVNMALSSVTMSPVEVAMFPMFTLLALVCLIILLRSTVEEDRKEARDVLVS
jgi:hypothetical protein